MTNLTNAERVRRHRVRRRNHNMVEIRVWVRAKDKEAALAAVEPYKQRAAEYVQTCLGYGWDSEDKIPDWFRPRLE